MTSQNINARWWVKTNLKYKCTVVGYEKRKYKCTVVG